MPNPTSESNGTQTATLDTEHSLDEINVAGTFQIAIEVDALAAGDIVEFRVYQKLLASGAQREVFCWPLSGVQAQKVWYSPLFPNVQTTDADALEFTLLQTDGTGRDFPWQIFKYT